MNCTLSSLSKDDNERLRRREKITFNRFLSFNENTLLSVENRRLINNSASNILEEDKNNINENLSFSFSYECNQCLKIFASEYGLNYHINMYHSNQSILCSICDITFRSHRALKNHQQRFHLIYSKNLPNYSCISPYLFVAFSAQQFPFITKNACEQEHLPLGELTSKLFQCQICYLSFPCSKALKYHLLNQHEQYEYKICKNILYDIIIQVEQNLKTVHNDDDIESIKFLLSKQASHFGLVDKQLARETRCIKHEHNRLIFPLCQHENRTCANLCLKHLSSYNKLIDNYPYKISTVPKGNPFAQGSIVSKPTNELSVDISIIPKDGLNSNQKRTSVKRGKSSIFDRSSSSPLPKRKLLEQPFKTNETKFLVTEQSSSIVTSPKKVNLSYARSLSSMSNNSSTSTRTSAKKSRQQTVASLKRSVSPTLTLAVERSSEKRRRQREQRKEKAAISSPAFIIKIDDDIQQENGADDDDDIVAIESVKPKQRQASDSSVEYVQILDTDKQPVPSLNNIENLKSKPMTDDKEIILCHSSPSVKRVISSSGKNQSKTSVNDNDIYKVNGHQTSDYDEHVRVRCKICGDILDGRSRFSKHVLTMHSHLLKSNISDIKQQQTTIVR